MTVDGKLDEAAWATAPLFDAFVQRYLGLVADDRADLVERRDPAGHVLEPGLVGLVDRRLVHPTGVAEVTVGGGRKLEVPVYIMPGHADGQLCLLRDGVLTTNASGLYGVSASADLQDSSIYTLWYGGPALGLPNRDYYWVDDESNEAIRDAYKESSAKLLGYLGYDEARATAAAEAVQSEPLPEFPDMPGFTITDPNDPTRQR